MQHLDIADLVRRSLLGRGCSAEQVGSFDGHSNIELQLTNLPSLNIEQLDQDVWLWSALEDCTPNLLNYCGADLLQFLMKGWYFARSGQMQLVDADGRLELRAMLNETALSSEDGMGDALDAFLEAMEAVQGIIRR